MKVLQQLAGVRIVPRASMAARDDAAAIVAAAHARAEAIVAAARAEADGIREASRREGEMIGGEQAAATVARARIEADRDAGAQTEAVVSLAMDVARTVLGREASSGPEVLREVAGRALARVRRARRIVLKVNPADVAHATTHARAWLPAGTDPEAVGIEADPSVDQGGVVIESELGTIDARLDRQLEAIARALRASG